MPSRLNPEIAGFVRDQFGDEARKIIAKAFNSGAVFHRRKDGNLRVLPGATLEIEVMVAGGKWESIDLPKWSPPENGSSPALGSDEYVIFNGNFGQGQQGKLDGT